MSNNPKGPKQNEGTEVTLAPAETASTEPPDMEEQAKPDVYGGSIPPVESDKVKFINYQHESEYVGFGT